MDAFPAEVLRMIFAYCNRNDLAAVRQVCHRWADVAETVSRTIFIVTKAIYKDQRMFDSTRIVYVEKPLLLNSTQKYTGFSIVWNWYQSERLNFQDLLNICQERFPVVRQLYLRAPPTTALATFFQTHGQWLQNLVELRISFVEGESSSYDRVCRITLPKLKRLYWYEHEHITSQDRFGDYQTDRIISKWHTFVLEAPELRQLSVEMDRVLNRKNLTSHLKGPEGCCLFLPTLELVSYSKVQYLTLTGLYGLNQRHIDNCEQFFRNLKMLSMSVCLGDVMQRICEKCSTLKELTIYKPRYQTPSIELFGVFAATLEKLSLVCTYDLSSPQNQFVFPNLHYLQLQHVSADAPWLIAPRLTTFVAESTDHTQIIIPHAQQLCTLGMDLATMKRFSHPLPNLTVLVLSYNGLRQVPLTINDHLRDYPKLRRLKLEGCASNTQLDSMLIERICSYNLEYLHLSKLTLQLSDLQKLADLTSLILSSCTIAATRRIQDALLTRVHYFRVEWVTIEGCSKKGRFPIRLNEQQVPIECVNTERNVFSSKNFEECYYSL